MLQNQKTAQKTQTKILCLENTMLLSISESFNDFCKLALKCHCAA